MHTNQEACTLWETGGNWSTLRRAQQAPSRCDGVSVLAAHTAAGARHAASVPACRHCHPLRLVPRHLLSSRLS